MIQRFHQDGAAAALSFGVEQVRQIRTAAQLLGKHAVEEADQRSIQGLLDFEMKESKVQLPRVNFPKLMNLILGGTNEIAAGGLGLTRAQSL